jgi:hypothetical protein
VLPLAVLSVIVLAACGGSSSANSAATSTTAAGGAAAGAAGFQAYRACLSQHGVDLPARARTGTPPSTGAGGGQGGGPPGGFGGGGLGGGGLGGTPPSLPKGVTAAQFAAAQKACASKLPAGGQRGAGGGAALQAYVSCLRDHGVTVSGSTSATTTAGAPRPTFDRNDPKFAAANKVCQALLPNRTTTTTAG